MLLLLIEQVELALKIQVPELQALFFLTQLRNLPVQPLNRRSIDLLSTIINAPNLTVIA